MVNVTLTGAYSEDITVNVTLAESGSMYVAGYIRTCVCVQDILCGVF